jgi:hypothetical protein
MLLTFNANWTRDMGYLLYRYASILIPVSKFVNMVS